MTQNSRDKRQARRVELLGDLFIEISDEKTRFKGDAMDLSANGIRFMSLVRLPLFREVAMRLRLPHTNHQPSKTIRCYGVVVRCIKMVDPFFEISLYFLDLNPKQRHILRHFIEVVGHPSLVSQR